MLNLLFDADGTLYDFEATENISLRKVFHRYGIPYSCENVRLYHEKNMRLWDLYEKGEICQDVIISRRFEDLFSCLGIAADAAGAGNYYVDTLAENGILIPGARAFLDALCTRHRMYIITNGIAKTQHGRIKGTDTEKYFEKIYISTEMGIQKPDKAFFDFVLSDSSLEKNRSIVIGDSAKSDIQGAVNAGLRSIYISFSGKVCPLATANASSYDEILEYIDKFDLED